MAISSLLAEHGIDGDTQRQHARPTPVTRLTPSVSIVCEPVSTPAIKKALSAALFVRTNTGPEPALPPRPSPDHTWVIRGSGGYWRKTSKKASK